MAIVVGAAVAKGRITRDGREPKPSAAPGVVAVLTTLDRCGQGAAARASMNTAQAVWRCRKSSTITRRSRSSSPKRSSRRAPPAQLIRTDYARANGKLRSCRRGAQDRAATQAAAAARAADRPADRPHRRFRGPPLPRRRSRSTRTYTTPDESHAMMEPHRLDRGLERRQADALDVKPDDQVGPRASLAAMTVGIPEGEHPLRCRRTSVGVSAGSCSYAPTRCSPRWELKRGEDDR